ncbi:peptidoglycan-binding protein [Salipaludibacillus sp. CUR1]|uniref:peptidoglycan-binding protein n=1 Tax=Salipaludibacillus sp. CUR1 TaxID=2820003 RepID=UPI001E3140C8|nr:peptidoglycan-binding protein [Salipaludibacillus sp. CUR1]MCE7791160.1 peptidoglycan-binding protein [Salipaludibacillus sp. CUR1]
MVGQSWLKRYTSVVLAILMLVTSTFTATAAGSSGNNGHNENSVNNLPDESELLEEDQAVITVDPQFFNNETEDILISVQPEWRADEVSLYIIDSETEDTKEVITFDGAQRDLKKPIEYSWDLALTANEETEDLSDGEYVLAAVFKGAGFEEIAYSDIVVMHSESPQMVVDNPASEDETLITVINTVRGQVISPFLQLIETDETVELFVQQRAAEDDTYTVPIETAYDEDGLFILDDILEPGENVLLFTGEDPAGNTILEEFHVEFLHEEEEGSQENEVEDAEKAVPETSSPSKFAENESEDAETSSPEASNEGSEEDETGVPEISPAQEKEEELETSAPETPVLTESEEEQETSDAHEEPEKTETSKNEPHQPKSSDSEEPGVIQKEPANATSSHLTDEDIIQLKRDLNELGFGQFQEPPDPLLDEQATETLKEFQQLFRLEETGEPDEATLQTIAQLLASEYRDGQEGDHIVTLKQNLTLLGFGNFPSSPSNRYGPVTAGVVAEFQAHFDLPVSGIADEVTLAQIASLFASPPFEDGDQALKVRELKQNLTELGYGNFPEEPSFNYGPVTMGVVKEFQEDFGLPVTGTADLQTIETIADILASGYQDGEEGDHIVTLKQNLTLLGFGNFPSNPSNRYGPVTEGVVKEFQAYYKLPVTGIADRSTLNKIDELISGSIYKEGERGTHVRVLKQKLTKLGFGNFPENPSTGYGPVTSGVVKDFQRYYGLTVSGMANDITLKKLDDVLKNAFMDGDNSRDISDMKKKLTALGFGNFPASPSTAYGPVTARVVEDFQSYYGLKVTGVFEEKTQEMMEKVLSSPLRNGQSSSRVVSLKKDMTKLGFTFPSSPSPNYGNVTERKVRELQQHFGLRVNGIADQPTLNKIREILNSPYRSGQNHAGVVELKKQLTSLGFYFPSNPSSAYGSVTEGRVKEFQRSQKLPVSGIADDITRKQIRQVLNSQQKIINGREIYSFSQMERDIRRLEVMYPGLVERKVIGRSVDGRAIHAVKLGRGSTEVFINGSHHAYEHMTTNVNMKMLDEYAYAYAKNQRIDGWNVRTVLNRTSIWFVPMVNPDGVELVQRGPSALSSSLASQAIRINGGRTNFTSWKANARGVDLNRQYPALWHTIENNPGRPSRRDYKGTSPLTEPEARAVYDFARSRDFKTALSYHSSGEVLFTRRPGHVARIVSAKTGYRIVDLTHSPSGGGFTDWFILNQGKPALTPEISPFVGPRPVPLSNWSGIWSRNNSVGLIVADEAYRNRNSR